MQKFKYLSKNKLGFLPKTPGVYAFKATLPSGQGQEFLYIGKAVNIRQRVKNHFQQPVFKDNVFIIPKTDKLGYIKTESEIEALLLEAELIKKYKPKYNVVWKDDKNYSFVEITKEDFPAVLVVHQAKKQARYIGPFVDSKALKSTLRILRRVFPYRTCRALPKKKCLFYDLALCNAPCLTKSKEQRAKSKMTEQNAKRKEYKKNIDNLVKILQGKKQQALRELKREMKTASGMQNFEKAAVLRNQIFALENVFRNARIIKEAPEKTVNQQEAEKKLRALLGLKSKIKRIEGYDISNIQGKEATGSMVVFEQGLPNKNEYRKFKIKMAGKPNDVSMLKETLTRRLQHPEWPFPQVMLIDGGRGQLNAAHSVVRELKSKIENLKYIKVIALAKKKNELFVEGKKKPVLLKNLPQDISNLVLQIRDEAHRFAISYHKGLRSKALLGKSS